MFKSRHDGFDRISEQQIDEGRDDHDYQVLRGFLVHALGVEIEVKHADGECHRRDS